MAGEEVLVEFRAEFDKLKKDYADIRTILTGISNDSKKAGEDVSTNVKQTTQNLGDLKSAAFEVGKALGLAFGIHQILDFGKESVKAFLEAEENAHRLAFAIKEIGNEGEAAFKKLIAQSEKLQTNSIFSDDDIQRAQTALATFGLTSKQIEQLIPKVLDLASATDKDLGSATQKVIQGINGQTRELKKVGIQYENTGKQVDNFAILMGRLDKFTGASTEALATHEGQLRRLGNIYDNIKESIGGLMVDALNPLIDILQIAFGGKSIKDTALFQEKLAEEGEKITKTFNSLGSEAQRTEFKKTIDAFNEARASLATAKEVNSKEIQDEIQGEVDVLKLKLKVQTDIVTQQNNSKKGEVDLTKLTNEQLSQLNTLAAHDEIKRREDLEKDKKDLAKKSIEEIKKLREQQRKDEIQAERDSIADAEKTAAQWLANEFELLQANNKLKISETKENTQERLDAQIEAITSEAEFRLRTEELTQTQIETIKAEGLAKVNELEAAQKERDDAFAEERYNEIVAQGEKQLEFRKQLAEAELDVERAKFDALLGLTDAFAGLVKGDAALSQSLLIFQRGLAIADVLYKLQQEKAAWYATAAEQSVIDPAGAAIHQAIALARAQAANVRAGVAAATIIAQTIPQLKFAEGTEYLERGRFKKGVDTIPILANEGERIIPTHDNMRNWDVYEALRLGKFDKYVALNYVAPAMEMAQDIHSRKKDKEFANNIYNSMMYNYGSDKGIEKLLKKGLYIKNMPDDKDKISLMEYKLLERRLNARG